MCFLPKTPQHSITTRFLTHRPLSIHGMKLPHHPFRPERSSLSTTNRRILTANNLPQLTSSLNDPYRPNLCELIRLPQIFHHNLTPSRLHSSPTFYLLCCPTQHVKAGCKTPDQGFGKLDSSSSSTGSWCRVVTTHNCYGYTS